MKKKNTFDLKTSKSQLQNTLKTNIFSKYNNKTKL